MIRSLKAAILDAYFLTRPGTYEVSFGGNPVRFLSDRPYTKRWYYRNRLNGALRGYHEPPLSLLLERLCEFKTCLLDVGAHLGYSSIMFASKAGNSATAIEFDPSNFRELERGLAWQPAEMRERLSCWNVGVSDEIGTIRLPRLRAHDSSRRIGASANDANDCVEVALVTLDSLIEQIGIQPDLIKIDVEGAELNVLRGAARLFARRRRCSSLNSTPRCCAKADRRSTMSSA